MERTAVWKTVPPTERSIRVNPRKIRVRKKNSEEMQRTRIIRIQRILSGGDNRSPSEASASIRKIRVRKKNSEEMKRTRIVRI